MGRDHQTDPAVATRLSQSHPVAHQVPERTTEIEQWRRSRRKSG